jgi:threonine dehydratase
MFSSTLASAFKALGKQAESIAIEPEDLDQIAASASEDEDVTGERLGFQCGLHHRA